MDIINEIQTKLKNAESEQHIRILYAVESGSRAWGFASPDSDYDVRFLYAHPMEWYLKLEKKRDVLELEMNEVYDINGWDIQKFFRLLHSSNPTAFEWMHAPIVYAANPEFTEMIPQMDSFFSCKAGLYHYLNTARSNYKAYLENKERVKLKKYFYVLRPLMACEWICGHQTPPPVLFDTLLHEMNFDDKLMQEILELISRKKGANETELIEKNPILEAYIASETSKIQRAIEEMPEDHRNDWNRLDGMFLKVLSQFQG